MFIWILSIAIGTFKKNILKNLTFIRMMFRASLKLNQKEAKVCE